MWGPAPTVAPKGLERCRLQTPSRLALKPIESEESEDAKSAKLTASEGAGRLQQSVRGQSEWQKSLPKVDCSRVISAPQLGDIVVIRQIGGLPAGEFSRVPAKKA